jgi:hypothetical protein
MSGARVAAWSIAVFLVVSVGLVGLARAEDAQDIRGTAHGCVDATVQTEWTALTSASLENSKGSSVLAGSLYWTEILIKGGSAAVYLCLAGASSCGIGTTNKLSVPAGATLSIPLRGLGVQTISLYGTGITGSAVQVCGYFRTGG